jgi:ribosomal protein L32E
MNDPLIICTRINWRLTLCRVTDAHGQNAKVQVSAKRRVIALDSHHVITHSTSAIMPSGFKNVLVNVNNLLRIKNISQIMNDIFVIW